MKTLETPLTWILVPLCLIAFYVSKVSLDEARLEAIKKNEIEAAAKIKLEERALLISEITINVQV